MKKYFLFLALALSVSLLGCDDPYISPDSSKAVSEKEQLEVMKVQSIYLQKQNQILERIAISLEKIANK